MTYQVVYWTNAGARARYNCTKMVEALFREHTRHKIDSGSSSHCFLFQSLAIVREALWRASPGSPTCRDWLSSAPSPCNYQIDF